MRRLRSAAVLGSGVMGAAIAAHLANAGVPVLLLDIVPKELTDDERKRGLALSDPRVRSRVAAAGKERAVKASPAAFFTPARANLVTVGNFEDHLKGIAECDWVIEAIVEDLAIKQQVLDRVEKHWHDGIVVSTNTSGLPVGQIVSGRSPAFQRHFLGTHFFNPPRYLKLLEVIPLPQTDRAVVEVVTAWGERQLGKGIVYAHDRPNFIANRIGSYGFRKAVQLMLEFGLTIEEVDELTGPLIGRPRSATFRTTDLVGLDTVIHVSENSYRNLADDPERDVFIVPPLFQEMAKRGWLGEKSGGGFYKRVDGEIYTLDYTTMEYRARQRAKLPGVEAARLIEDPAKRMRQLLSAPEKAGQFLWQLTSSILAYAAKRVPEIADDVVNVDRAMRWGFAWDIGPFETWDLLGVAEIATRLQDEGREVPDLVREVMDRGGTFYRKQNGTHEYFDVAVKTYRPVPERPNILWLPTLKDQGRTVASNPGATLVDIGDGIACLEFHSKLNTIGEDTLRMASRALDEVRKSFDGLVIGNHGADFSAGANLMLMLLEAQEGNWDDIAVVIRQFQRLNLAIRYFEKPVVAAPAGRTLAGGCEVCLPCARIQAAAETYLGLVEVGMGLIPAGGGTTEMVRRAAVRLPPGVDADLFPPVRFAFETIALAKVSLSAEEAFTLGYLREGDGISMNGAHLLHDAKEVCLSLVRTGSRPPLRQTFKVVGERGLAAIEAYLYLMRTAGHISEHDAHVSARLAHVACGGRVPYGTDVSEEYMHDLEREAFVSLLGHPRTQERIRHFLQTGRPLRN
ncbi:MAG TPA: 3-hydroxyacyl-CoA dehydrogenase/enoyl-CoA hydratase family protein [bacterium]|nr:3-hydroxyacyl-CoA dehydrogenase/enoyl-CoA hydratase family protein [bacterium]